MAKSRKNRSTKPRKTVRGRRSSAMGRIMPLVDVRSPKHMKELEKRIMKGPLTIIMVYADWCGHCHTMMPHFKDASKSPNRQIQSVMLNEQMLGDANSYIKSNVNQSAKPINVSGYPSIILVDNKANKVTEIEPVRDTEVMTKVMSNSAALAKNSGLVNNSSETDTVEMEKVLNKIKAKTQNTNVGEEELMGSIVETNTVKKVTSNKKANKVNLNSTMAPSPLNSLGKSQNKRSLSLPKSLENEVKRTASLMNSPITSLNRNGSINTVESTGNNTVTPPVFEEDIEEISREKEVKGGNLMTALSRATYTLAPPAILLASASYIMKGKKTRGRPKKLIKKVYKGKKTQRMRK